MRNNDSRELIGPDQGDAWGQASFTVGYLPSLQEVSMLDGNGRPLGIEKGRVLVLPTGANITLGAGEGEREMRNSNIGSLLVRAPH